MYNWEREWDFPDPVFPNIPMWLAKIEFISREMGIELSDASRPIVICVPGSEVDT